MKNYIYTLLFAVVVATSTSCTYTFPEAETPTAGTANFTKLVAVGNSLTAGYMNGALYNEGQANSFANLIAQQMQATGGGAFNQPDINSEIGYFGMVGSVVLGRLHLVGLQSPAPAPIIPGDLISPFTGDKTALNNFGVPGIRVIDIEFSGYGTLNPYYGRFASDPTASVLDDAVAANGTFFTFWLGGNDVLGYALAGATGQKNGNGLSTNDMTPIAMFEGAYNSAINAMLANGSKGIVANIPNIQDIPHFTTVPWNAIPMDAATADGTNAAYVAYNGGLEDMVTNQLITQTEANLRKVFFYEGANGIVISDTQLTDLSAYGLPSIRMANSNDLITLTAGSVLGTLADATNPSSVIGVGVPLDEKYTLILADQEAIANRVAEFNAIISATVSANSDNLALLDVNAFFADFAQNGASVNGAGMDASIIPPFGAFSLDGVHPNSRGAAYVASLFIDKINETFSSNIPNLNPNNYPGNELPVP